VSEPSGVTTTYLELSDPGALRAAEWPDAAAVVVPCRPTLGFYRYLLAEVGGPWRWTDRVDWDDERLATHLADPGGEPLPVAPPRLSGRVLRAPSDARRDEIVYFGLAPEYIGRGLGGPFLTAAVPRGARRRTATGLAAHLLA
jgi:hypothetical protein